jgi:hypothetical protein
LIPPRGEERRDMPLYQAVFFEKAGNAKHRVSKKADKKTASYFQHISKGQFSIQRENCAENMFEQPLNLSLAAYER